MKCLRCEEPTDPGLSGAWTHIMLYDDGKPKSRNAFSVRSMAKAIPHLVSMLTSNLTGFAHFKRCMDVAYIQMGSPVLSLGVLEDYIVPPEAMDFIDENADIRGSM